MADRKPSAGRGSWTMWKTRVDVATERKNSPKRGVLSTLEPLVEAFKALLKSEGRYKFTRGGSTKRGTPLH